MVVKTREVNVPCSISITLSAYCLFFSFSCFFQICLGVKFCKSLHGGDTPERRRNADLCLPQKPRAWISKLPSGALSASWFNISPVTYWRTGSTSTSLQTILSISASKSRSLFWRWIMNPPRWHSPLLAKCTQSCVADMIAKHVFSDNEALVTYQIMQ